MSGRCRGAAVVLSGRRCDDRRLVCVRRGEDRDEDEDEDGVSVKWEGKGAANEGGDG